MATFYNQATLSFGGNVVNSNTTEAELLSGLEITKTAITGTYTAGANVVYAITVRNMGSTAYDDLTVSDDLGAYTVGASTVTPLDYVEGSVIYYLNGVQQTSPTVSTDDGLEFSDIDLPAGSTATIIYQARANGSAPLAQGSTITNTASTNGGAGIGEITASATISVSEAPQLTIAKAVCPAVVADNGQLTYTLIVQNLGNTPILATDNVVISDVFNPVLTDITVTLDGVALAEGTGYTYDTESGAFATTAGTVTVPSATYVQDPVSGVISTTPGVSVLTVTGTV